jgi:curli biogenesis system outer membrane secretion channel CsgG
MTIRLQTKTRSKSKSIAILLLGGIFLSASISEARFGKKLKEKLKRGEKKQEEIVAPYNPPEGWHAYFEDENGGRPVNPLIQKNEDKDWMFLKFSNYEGKKHRIAVMDVDGGVGQNIETGTQLLLHLFAGEKNNTNRATAIEDMVAGAIFGTRRFDVIERKRVQDLMEEQNFNAFGRVVEDSAVEIGQLLGAQYLLFVTINEWTPEKKVVGAIGFGKKTAEIALSFHLIDTLTGSLAYAHTHRSTAKNWGVSLAVWGKSEKSPISYAIQSCINKAAYAIAMEFKDKEVLEPEMPQERTTVASVENGQIFLVGGRDKGYTVGTIYSVLAKFGELKVGSRSLGFRTEVIGSIQITLVEPKFSRAVIIEGCDGIKEGDFLDPEKPEEGGTQ